MPQSDSIGSDCKVQSLTPCLGFEVALNFAQSTEFAGNLYGKPWTAGASKILGAAGLIWDIGSIAIKAFIAHQAADWNNQEYVNVYNQMIESVRGMDLELGTMEDMMGLLRENQCP